MTEAKKEYRSDDRIPSDLFLRIVRNEVNGFGSDEMTCGWCNRHHMCPDNEYSDRDNKDRIDYRKYCMDEKEKNPEGVVLHYDCDSVLGYDINGITFVIECPCNGLSRYESFIWRERNLIRAYLKQKIELEYSLAEQELTKNKLVGFDKKPVAHYF